MAAYTITASEVTPGSGAVIAYAIAGEAITAGQAIYLDASDNNEAKLAQADGTAAQAACVGVAINGAAAGQTVGYVKQGDVNLDTAALTGAAKGEVTSLGATAGGLYPNEDVQTTEYVTVVGVMKTSNPGVLTVSIIQSGVTHV